MKDIIISKKAKKNEILSDSIVDFYWTAKIA